jgi:hypothetical protein
MAKPDTFVSRNLSCDYIENPRYETKKVMEKTKLETDKKAMEEKRLSAYT